MDFNNLRRNILVGLVKKWCQSNHGKSFSLHFIRSEFSDIPIDDLEASIRSLHYKGFILLSDDKRSARLTQKGLKHMHVIHTDKNDEEIIMAKKIA